MSVEHANWLVWGNIAVFAIVCAMTFVIGGPVIAG